MLSGRDGLGESRMWEICMSGSTRERKAAVIGLWAFHSVLSSLLYWLIFLGCGSAALGISWFESRFLGSTTESWRYGIMGGLGREAEDAKVLGSGCAVGSS